jgi:hypothetical protein
MRQSADGTATASHKQRRTSQWSAGTAGHDVGVEYLLRVEFPPCLQIRDAEFLEERGEDNRNVLVSNYENGFRGGT